MAGYVPLTPAQYPTNAMLDFSGINNALDTGLQQQEVRQNAMLRRQQLGMEGARLKIAQDAAGRQATVFQQEQQDRHARTLAGLAQNVLDAPPEQRPQLLDQWRKVDPELDKDLAAGGYDPANVDHWAPVLIAKARGYQDPMKAQESAADIDLKKAQAQYYRGGGGMVKGYRVNPDTGLLEFIPGGPADPATIAAQSQARGRGRQFSVNDIEKLNEEGTRLQNIRGFASTFKPEYAGYGVGGDLAMFAGRIGMAGPQTRDAAEWWQSYDRYKNEVRHSLFGGALTPNETQQFEKADINPNTDPAIIDRNLARQQQLVEAGIRRKAAALAQAKYDPDVIANAYGIDPASLGATGGPAAGPQPGAVEDGYRFRGGNPADPNSWEPAQ